MLRKRRTTILVKGRQEVAKSMAQEITKSYEVKPIQPPASGLVMVKMRESSQKKLFYLGEVLVTECKVQIKEAMGLGIIQGQQPELAYWLAVIDAAYNASLSECEAWEAILLAEEEKIMVQEAQELSRIMRTKVDFATMDV